MAETHNGVSITIHGLEVDNRAVRAKILLQKFRAMVLSLQAADRAANHTATFRYMVADLSISSAHARVEEHQVRNTLSPQSGVHLYSMVMKAIYEGDKNIDRYPATVVRPFATLGLHAGTTFSHAEIGFDDSNVIRVDSFFEDQARRAMQRLAGEDDEPHGFYAGIAYGSFDGVLRELDSRGALVQGKVVLTAGHVEIDCIFNRDDIPHVLECFERRTIIEALAHYDAGSALPVRLDVRRIHPIKDDPDMTRWRGALRPRISKAW